MNRFGSSPRRVLIIDDEPSIRELVAQLLTLRGLEPCQAGSGEAGLANLRQGLADVALLDMNMPGLNGLEVLKEARKIVGCPPIIIVTGYGTITSAVEAVKSGAYDYVTKPFENDDLILTVRRALESHRLQRENQQLRREAADTQSLCELMGYSDAVKRLIAELERVAPTDFTVVISGETGSGKELVARAIHRGSNRASGPFIPVDCGAIQPTLIESELFGHEKGAFTGADRPRPGRFEAAAGGTLFLDEVQNLPLPVQTNFLRALQERQIYRVGSSKPIDIDFRVVAASNQNLTALAEDGRFREDLYHRLNEFTITVPPLRDRSEDVVHLVNRFIGQTSTELRKEPPRITPEAMNFLQGQAWPGNVRELRNVIRRGVLLANAEIDTVHLGLSQPPAAAAVPPRPEACTAALDEQTSLKDIVRRQVARVEREVMQQALKQARGNKAKAARLLQIDYKTMQTKTREYGLSPVSQDEAGTTE